jgi:predicted RNA binding protein YcfA (HicA-like mRNA interferase family)
MPKIPRISAERMRRALLRDGFIEHHQKGSHLVMVHPERHRRTSVPMHPGTLKVSTIHKIMVEAGLTVEDLIRLLD